jgi:oxygen-independent coproporphyrinogen-3 oxidase
MNAPQYTPLFEPALLRRFDINGPRYTSYPTADRFHNGFGAGDYQAALMRRAGDAAPLSLYFHLPFCPNICYYCGCNKIITKDHGRSAKYIRYLAREMNLVTRALGAENKRLPVTQLHWGGGTPTFLSRDEMRELMQRIRQHFDLLPGWEYSIEIDPRQVVEADIALLAELGFNRISLGVQDFNPDVQQAVHRIQSEQETGDVIRWARRYGFTSTSVDLIYGLPKQTPASFCETVQKVLAMNPDRLSVYSYAHLPTLFKPQRRIAEDELPNAADKLEILSDTIAQLTTSGYVFIGMDHFAKPDNELAVAQREKRLHRNFQGYSTQAECDLLAFGISSIGKVSDVFAQNVRTLDEYYDRIDLGQLPTLRGFHLQPDDLIRRELIGELMCQFELDTNAFAARHGISFQQYFAPEMQEMEDLQKAGLVQLENAVIRVQTKGRLLVRRVAMAFDRYLREGQTQARYSKVV